MKLYHGGIEAIVCPQIIRVNYGRDFGPAFYTTDIKTQAERWAWRRYQTTARHNGEAQVKAVVSVYEFDEKAARAQLDFLDFPEATLEWLELVVACRANNAFSPGQDVIVGKIANDRVGETITFVLNGIMRKEDALERLKFQHINNQIAFCTERALAHLRYESSYIVESYND